MIAVLHNYLSLWDDWREKSVNRNIFASTLTVSALSFFVKLVATAKDVVVAHQFGTGDALDAFLIAFLVPSFMINLVAGSFNTAFIPTYILVREHDGIEKAQQLFSNVIGWSIILLVTLSALLILTGKTILPFLAVNFALEKLALTYTLFFTMLPILVISGLATIWAAVLNAGKSFALTAIAPLATPILVVVILLQMGNAWGIYALAVGTIAGFIMEAGFLAWGLKCHRISFIPRWWSMDIAMRQIIKQYLPMVAGAFLMSGTTLVDRAMAAMLKPGSVSALSYGHKIVSFFLGIGSTALGTVVLPHFSEMSANGDWYGLRHTLKVYTRLILVVTVLLTLISIYLSTPLVRLLFERGAFTAADTRQVSQVQMFYLLQIPFYMLGIIIVRLISAVKANHLLMWAAFINFILNIMLNYLFMQWLGVAGIALSTAIVYLVSTVYCWSMLNKRIQKPG